MNELTIRVCFSDSILYSFLAASWCFVLFCDLTLALEARQRSRFCLKKKVVCSKVSENVVFILFLSVAVCLSVSLFFISFFLVWGGGGGVSK